MAATEKEVFTTSRAKSGLGLVGALAFCAVGMLMIQDEPSGIMPWLCTAFFGLCATVFALQCARPFRLFLDREGFVLSGGLRTSPLRVAWGEVDQFFVHSTSHRYTTTRSVGYNFKHGSTRRSALVKLNRALGADDTLPALWQEDPEELVIRLNQYREQALKSWGVD